MNYEEAMSYIQEVGNFGSNYGLERTYRILELLGNPQNELKIIHIAGTNGKGSITSMTACLLKEKGFKVGMYTSPFLEEFEERIQINFQNIPKGTLARLMTKVKGAVDTVISEGYNHPTEFEIITCLMYYYFYLEKVDYAVVEVGLGGRLDSTNCIMPIISVIASISFDHTNLLGETLKEIATEKSGIIKKDVPVIIYPQEQEAYDVIIEKAKKEGSKVYEALKDYRAEFLEVVQDDRYYQRISVNNYVVDLPLLGEHQINNFLTALKVYEVLCKIENINFDFDEVIQNIKSAKWIGRLEVLKKNPLLVIDGAHNIQGITALTNNIQKYFKYNKLYLILGILADKEVEKMVKMIAPLADKVITLAPHSSRAEKSDKLKEVVLKYNKNCISLEEYKEALDVAMSEAQKDDLIVVSGSLYMIGDMRKIINNL